MKVIYCTLLILNGILISLQGDFILLTPEEPFVAIAGEDVVLECDLYPPTSASNMAVQWLKSGLSSPIHVYRHGQADPFAQHPDYRGRTEMFKDEITKGIVSLRIRNVRRDDEGQYTCSVEDRTDFEQSAVELRVQISGSKPRIQMTGYHGVGIQLVCKSSGWYPEPEIQWIGGDGNALTEAETKYHRDSGLVNVESSVGVTRQSSGKLKCIIRSERSIIEHTAIITISDNLFPAVVQWALLLVTICVLIAANSTVIYWNVKQNRRIKELELQKSIVESVWKRICGHEEGEAEVRCIVLQWSKGNYRGMTEELARIHWKRTLAGMTAKQEWLEYDTADVYLWNFLHRRAVGSQSFSSFEVTESLSYSTETGTSTHQLCANLFTHLYSSHWPALGQSKCLRNTVIVSDSITSSASKFQHEPLTLQIKSPLNSFLPPQTCDLLYLIPLLWEEDFNHLLKLSPSSPYLFLSDHPSAHLPVFGPYPSKPSLSQASTPLLCQFHGALNSPVL
ncbi:butyrophilin subfamily 3 member A2-like isoform X1 [Hemitrygon akajei]|uniref:butyrophilin subfamily 3 member A2-like isoform X1 n=1 Tax=Hemitrygon akajei TaxID=2704970 RepID=UPI003BFA2C9E